MNQFLAKKKKKTIYLISAIIATVAIGGIVYWAWPKKPPKTETKSTTEQKISQLQQQLNQIKNALTTLNNNITQTETSLQQKRTEQTQIPQPSLQTQINQLETQLTTYKNQKKKLEIIIPKLEQQIGNLNKGENNFSQQEKIIEELEKEIKEVNEELGIKDEKKDDPKKPDKPKKDDNPGKESKPEDDNNPKKTPPYPNDTFLTPEEKQKHLEDLKKEAEKEAKKRGAKVVKISDPQQVGGITEQAKSKGQLSRKEVEDIFEKDNQASFSDYWQAALNKLEKSDLPETYLDFSENQQRFDLLQEYLNQRIKVAQLNKKIRPSLENFPNLSDTDSLVKWLNNHFSILIEIQTIIAWQDQLAKYIKMLHIPLKLKIYGLLTGKKEDWYTNPHLNWVFYYHQFEETPNEAIDYRKK